MSKAIAGLNMMLWFLALFGAGALLMTGLTVSYRGVMFLFLFPSLGYAGGVISALLATTGVLIIAFIPWWITWCARMIQE